MFPCHCFDNTSEVAIAPRTAAIAVLTSQTVAEELDRGLLEDFNGKTPATHANASSSQIAATKHAMEVLLLFFLLVVFDFTFFFHFLLFYASVATTGVALSRALRGTSAGIGERSKEEEGLMTSFGIYDLCTDFLSSVLHFLQQQQQ